MSFIDSITAPNQALLAYRGSIAHGMYVPDSDPDSIDDVDLMGVVLAPSECYLGLSEWGSRGTKERKEGRYDLVLYELRKFVSLLLQGNPNVLSMLWLRPQHYLKVSPAGRRLIENRNMFVGRHVHYAFAGYARSQLERMESRDPSDLRQYMAVDAEMKFRGIHPNHRRKHGPEPDREVAEHRNVQHWGDVALLEAWRSYQKKGENLGYLGDKRKRLVVQHGFDTKNAAHLIRLLRMGREFLGVGHLHVDRSQPCCEITAFAPCAFEPDAGELLQIKRGKWELERVKAHAAELFSEVKQAKDGNTIPEAPDRALAERLVMEILREHLA